MGTQWLTKDAGLKAISLLLATAIWFFVRGVTSDSRVIDGVPLEIRVKPDLAILQESASNLTVTVRGTRDDVRQVSRQDLSAAVDLTHDETNGEITVHLGGRSIRHSRRVQVTEVDPSEITVNIDRLIERELPVQPQLSGELPPSVAVERVATTPETVRLKGPKTVLDGLNSVATLPIDLTNRRTSFRERVDLAAPPSVSEVSLRRWVEVDVRIGPSPPVDSGASRGVQGTP